MANTYIKRYSTSLITQFSLVQSLSCVWLFATPWIAAHQASLSITNSRSLLKLLSIESVMPSSHLILCHPLLLLPPIPPSIRVFFNESTLPMTWSEHWSFSFSISPSSEHPGLISFGMDWLDLLAVQGTLKSLLQHHSSKASVFWYSAFVTIQLTHPYMTTGKTIALTRWTFVVLLTMPKTLTVWITINCGKFWKRWEYQTTWPASWETYVQVWNSLAFLMIQQMLAIWSLVPLPFLKPAWTTGSSHFSYCWSLAWRILSITLLVCEISAIVQ